MNSDKDIPVLCVTAKTLAEAYEEALIALYRHGIRFKTQYDKPNDPLSIDATMNITVREPLADPMIHKAFPGGISDLREYVYELEGAKDNWVKNMNDSDDKKWEYTYHGRFANWGQWREKQYIWKENVIVGNKNQKEERSIACGVSINQFNYVINKLCKQPFSRQAQMITWMPQLDLDCYDPPCLQSIWFRILEVDDIWYLNYNVRFRSNDAWGAYFINSFGLTMMIKELVADKIAEKTGKKVTLGRMNWQADSWHIYGKDIRQAEERFFNKLNSSSFDDRVYNFYDETIQEIYKESEAIILEKIRIQNENMGR
jgi:thymidylate synthase